MEKCLDHEFVVGRDLSCSPLIFNLLSLAQCLALNRCSIKCKEQAFPVNTLNTGEMEKYIQCHEGLDVHILEIPELQRVF